MQKHLLNIFGVWAVMALLMMTPNHSHADESNRQIAPSQTVRGSLTPIYIGGPEKVYRICGAEASKSNLNSNLDIYVDGSVVYKLPINRTKLCVDVAGRKIEAVAEDQTFFTFEAIRQ